MKKNLVVVLALVMLVTASCDKSENKSKKEQSPADGSDEIVVSTAPTSNMDFDMFHDYVVYDAPSMEEPIRLRVEDYVNDESSFKIQDLRSASFKDIEKIETAKKWIEESKKYKTAEDALLIMYISHVKEYVTEKVAGSASITVNLLIRDGNSFDILSINRDRLRYKFEVVANRFGFTTKGRVGLSLDNIWYNIYPLEDTNQ